MLNRFLPVRYSAPVNVMFVGGLTVTLATTGEELTPSFVATTSNVNSVGSAGAVNVSLPVITPPTVVAATVFGRPATAVPPVCVNVNDDTPTVGLVAVIVTVAPPVTVWLADVTDTVGAVS